MKFFAVVTAFESALDRLKKTQSGEHGTKALSCALIVCLPGLKTWGHHEVRRNTKTPCTQSEQRHCLAHMLSFPSIFLSLFSPVSFLHLRSQCCQPYLWFPKLSKLQFDVKSLVFTRELPLLPLPTRGFYLLQPSEACPAFIFHMHTPGQQ